MFRLVILVVSFQSLLITGCINFANAESGLTTEISSEYPAAQLLDLSQRYLTLAEANDDFLRNGSGSSERKLPDRSLNGIKRVAAQADVLLQQLNVIAIGQLSHEDTLTAAL